MHIIMLSFIFWLIKSLLIILSLPLSLLSSCLSVSLLISLFASLCLSCPQGISQTGLKANKSLWESLSERDLTPGTSGFLFPSTLESLQRHN